MEIINIIKEKINVNVREDFPEGDYLDSVIQSSDVAAAENILNEHLGTLVRDNIGNYPDISKDLKDVVEELGGIWEGQSMYFKEDGNRLVYALLRPWGSNPDNVTLVIGVFEKQ